MNHKNRIKVNCDYCGKILYKIPSVIEKTKKHYCDSKCYHEDSKKHEYQTCNNCGKEFYSPRKQKYCSRECYLKGNKTTKVCIGCGEKFTVPGSNADRYNYCSFECKKENSLGEYRNCKNCGEKFYVKATEVRENINRQYCSRKCRTEDLNYEMRCDNCGKIFNVTESEKETRRFCSKECAMKFSGETSIEKEVRKSLDRLNIKHKKQYNLLTYFIDFALTKDKVAIESDGDYWHNLKKTKNRDIKRDNELSKIGWTTIRISESTINELNKKQLDELIKSEIEQVTNKEITYEKTYPVQMALF